MSGPRFQRGDIVNVPTPHADRSASSRHPALIVGDPLANRHGDYVLVQITSQKYSGRSDFRVVESDADFPATGLDNASTIRCHKLFVYTETMVHQRRGEASPRIMKEVESRLRDLLSL